MYRSALGRHLTAALVAAGMACHGGLAAAGPGMSADPDAIDRGRAIALDRALGNCVSCHLISGARVAGNVGPPLNGLRARFADRETLRAQIDDPTRSNPDTVMPPYGRHRLLSDTEIDQLVEFLWTL